MKYIRKILTFLTVFVMLAAIAIGIGVIYAVKNVNVTLLSYSCAVSDSDSEEEAAQKTQVAEELIIKYKNAVLNKFKGSIMLFVTESGVSEVISGGEYVLDKCEKVYPCTLNITLRERMETFIVIEGDRFRLYDEYGVYLKTVKEDSWEDVANSLDGAPDILIEGNVADKDIKQIAEISAFFRSNFNNLLRSVVKSIEYKVDVSKHQSDLVFNMRCGLAIEIWEFNTKPEEKIRKAADVFYSLSGTDTLRGRIISCDITGGAVNAYHSFDNK